MKISHILIIKKMLKTRCKYLWQFCIHKAGVWQDWQYVRKIHLSLKENNFNEVMSYLIYSYLDGIVLDCQTFYNVYQTLNHNAVSLNYIELLYRLYRTNFAPNVLTIQWMQQLERSKNPETLQLLKNDFEKLGMKLSRTLGKKLEDRKHRGSSKMEQTRNQEVINKEQLMKEQAERLLEEIRKLGKGEKIEKGLKVDHLNKLNKTDENKKSDETDKCQQDSKNNTQQKKPKHQTINTIQIDPSKLHTSKIFSQLLTALKDTKNKITLHNFQAQFDNHEIDGLKMDTMDEKFQLLTNLIKNINIGKIEIDNDDGINKPKNQE